MIKSKHMLEYYLECDRVALGINRRKPRLIGDEIWKYQRYMRMLDYANTARSGGEEDLPRCFKIQVSCARYEAGLFDPG